MSHRFLSIACPGIELRAAVPAATAADTATPSMLVGYAAKFNTRSAPLGGFVEQIAPGAFDGCLGDDVVALFNHDPSMVLGRSSAGSVRLGVDATGLRYEVDLADDEVSQRVASYIADGRVSQSSFGFTTAAGGDSWDQQDDGVILRTIGKVGRLFDVSPVTYAAYPSARVMLRTAFQEAKEVKTLIDKALMQRASNARSRELELISYR